MPLTQFVSNSKNISTSLTDLQTASLLINFLSFQAPIFLYFVLSAMQHNYLSQELYRKFDNKWGKKRKKSICLRQAESPKVQINRSCFITSVVIILCISESCFLALELYLKLEIIEFWNLQFKKYIWQFGPMNLASTSDHCQLCLPEMVLFALHLTLILHQPSPYVCLSK